MTTVAPRTPETDGQLALALEPMSPQIEKPALFPAAIRIGFTALSNMTPIPTEQTIHEATGYNSERAYTLSRAEALSVFVSSLENLDSLVTPIAAGEKRSAQKFGLLFEYVADLGARPVGTKIEGVPIAPQLDKLVTSTAGTKPVSIVRLSLAKQLLAIPQNADPTEPNYLLSYAGDILGSLDQPKKYDDPTKEIMARILESAYQILATYSPHGSALKAAESLERNAYKTASNATKMKYFNDKAISNAWEKVMQLLKPQSS